jgi:DNA-binding transcriptional LysR family regulator
MQGWPTGYRLAPTDCVASGHARTGELATACKRGELRMRYPDIDIGLLRCFACVTDQGSFTAASHVLRVTQSAVSLQIKRLERLIGKRVFDRTSRSIVLTQDGELLLTYARRMLALNDEIIRRILVAPLRGHLRLGVAEHFLPRHIPTILSEFLSTYPDVQLEIETGRSSDLRASYKRGQLELLIAEPGGADDIGQPIMSEELVWTAARPGAMPEHMGVAGHAIRLVLRTPGCPFREAALDALQQAKIPYRIVYTSPGLLAVIAAAEAGLGVTVVGHSALVTGLAELAGLPSLGTLEMSIFGAIEEDKHLAGTLVEFIRNRLPSTVTKSPDVPGNDPLA